MVIRQSPAEHLLTPAEVAAIVFVDPKTVSRWASKGKIPCTRTSGGHRRFRGADVQALVPTRDQGQRARQTRAIADAEAARVVADAAAIAAATIRSLAVVQAGYRAEAVAQAERLVLAASTDAETSSAAVRVLAAVRAADDAASAEVVAAEVRVARAVTDAATHVAATVARYT